MPNGSVGTTTNWMGSCKQFCVWSINSICGQNYATIGFVRRAQERERTALGQAAALKVRKLVFARRHHVVVASRVVGQALDPALVWQICGPSRLQNHFGIAEHASDWHLKANPWASGQVCIAGFWFVTCNACECTAICLQVWILRTPLMPNMGRACLNDIVLLFDHLPLYILICIYMYCS